MSHELHEIKTRIHNLLEVRLLCKQLKNYNEALEQTVLERTAALRDSEARFQRLTQLASDWYWEQDQNSNFTKVFGPVLEMLGIPADALLGESKTQPGARWNDSERAALEANIAARRPFLDYVYSRTNADGTQQFFQVSGEPMFDFAGRFTGYRGVGKDVTRIMSGITPWHVARPPDRYKHASTLLLL